MIDLTKLFIKNVLTINTSKQVDNNDLFYDKDMEEFGLPVTLMLETYNPKSDAFNCKDFKKVRDNYNNRIGYSQIIIKGCSDEADRENLKSLGFTVEEN